MNLTFGDKFEYFMLVYNVNEQFLYSANKLQAENFRYMKGDIYVER